MSIIGKWCYMVTIRELSEKIHLAPSTIRTYIFRPEFKHLKLVKIRNAFAFEGVTDSDLQLLQKIIQNRVLKNIEY